MTDSAYINPSELDRYRPMIHHETRERTPGDIGLSNLMLLQVIESHAVVDSIAAEAISILRMEPTLDHSCDLEEWDESCNECRFIRKARAVVQRFDNLTKGTE